MTRALILILMLAATPALAFDGNALAQHLRETLNLDTRTAIEVQGAPRPSGVGNLDKVTVLVGGAPYDVHLTRDGKTYLWGFTADISVSPDRQRAANIDLTTGHSIGSSSAPVTVVEYSDFACSHCRRAHEILSRELHKAYKPDQVRWVYKHFPLTTHPWATTAAVAAECAAAQKPGAFWDMADYFFSSQDGINEKNVTEKSKAQAAKLGLKSALFNSCLASPDVMEKVTAQKKEGASIGASSTPTLFINGRMRRGFRDFEDVKVMIDEKLGNAGR